MITRRLGLSLVAAAAVGLVMVHADDAQARHRGNGSYGSAGGHGSRGSFGGLFSRFRNNGSDGGYGSHGSHGGYVSNGSCGSHGGAYYYEGDRREGGDVRMEPDPIEPPAVRDEI